MHKTPKNISNSRQYELKFHYQSLVLSAQRQAKYAINDARQYQFDSATADFIHRTNMKQAKTKIIACATVLSAFAINIHVFHIWLKLLL